MLKLSEVISTFFGTGFFPLAPGTLASFLALLIYRYILSRLAWPYYLLLLLFVVASGIYFSTIYARHLNLKDPGKIVIDEVAGQLLALFLVKPDWKWLATSFLLFRFFDIIKPLGIKRLEKISWGWGIMADDLAAGLLAAIGTSLVILAFK
ncbi:MAG TPA: phosphatidylglycerophosphatase A [Candidatus Saccharicenans sp.]|jgi:phosphatidylglycerophosphatase A|nr:phosphatidylglycerophosphatase A [Candidatus Saccharicenans sp.]HRD01142.1 phosphatidylglycerophosphatase A [Candidatus Saccharicenans sp.]